MSARAPFERNPLTLSPTIMRFRFVFPSVLDALALATPIYASAQLVPTGESCASNSAAGTMLATNCIGAYAGNNNNKGSFVLSAFGSVLPRRLGGVRLLG